MSYPRTETEKYKADFDLQTLITEQRNHPDWGDFATRYRSARVGLGGVRWVRPDNGTIQTGVTLRPGTVVAVVL